MARVRGSSGCRVMGADRLHCRLCGPSSVRQGVDMKDLECCNGQGFLRSEVDKYAECRRCHSKMSLECLSVWRRDLCDRGSLHAVSSRQRRTKPGHGAHRTTCGRARRRRGAGDLLPRCRTRSSGTARDSATSSRSVQTVFRASHTSIDDSGVLQRPARARNTSSTWGRARH